MYNNGLNVLITIAILHVFYNNFNVEVCGSLAGQQYRSDDIVENQYILSHLMRKPDFGICKTKGADQLRGIATLIFLFISLYFPIPKFQAP